MMTGSELQRLIAAWLDGRISESDSELLQQQLRDSADSRATFRGFVKLDAAIRELAGDVLPAVTSHNASPNPIADPSPATRASRWKSVIPFWARLVLAASVLLVVGGIAYQLGKGDTAQQTERITGARYQSGEDTEKTIAGYATLRRAVDLKWPVGATSYREGDVLSDGVFQFDAGVAEIDFFCGATLIVEGPASLDVESDWSVSVTRGRLRANVPPAARGFVVKAAGSEIVDLGTEFALEVGPENARVEVIDGEIELRGGQHDGNHLVTGQRKWLRGMSRPDAFEGLSTVNDVKRQRADAETTRIMQWKKYSQSLSNDERLIVYYPITENRDERVVRNMAVTGRDLDGKLVGPVDRTTGRFGIESAGVEFDRPGSRVRTRIDGEFTALTFACWAKIDSLEHVYNALFLADGYENGEPHWQIRNDGRLMISVMVDDTKSERHYSEAENQVVTSAGLARVYYTDRFWDISKSGQWFHLAAVYDPVGHRVSQYVNGQELGSDLIIDKFHVSKLRIGAAEIGNWGQPFRESPSFAVRNLNGTIDEMAIFDAALDSEEILAMYEQGKPVGY